MLQLQDSFGRTFKTLRVSLLNSCNLACSYCVNPDVKSKPDDIFKKDTRLNNEQFIDIIDTLHKTLQLSTIRLTGGEPLLYKSLLPLIDGIKKTGINNIKITTNGVLLAEKAKALKERGITSINISLDTIDDATSMLINKKNNLDKIIAGIESCIDTGIPVKINCVVMRGINDNNLMQVFEFCKQRNITVRFLELMEMGHLYHNYEDYFFSEASILSTIKQQYTISPVIRKQGATANYWTTQDGFKFGIIANNSSPFCDDCNRLRLDSYGNIFGCLSNDTPIPVKEYIREPKALTQKLEEALSQKQMKFSGSKLSMLHIGG
jgi:cyclic pyranopterin phosphate synthase